MKIMMKTKVETWLPVFSGFYGTIWETDNDEEMELEYINDQRREKGLNPIEWDEVEWDYKDYSSTVAKNVTKYIQQELKTLGMVSKIEFQCLRSPRAYNFANDAIDIKVTLSTQNKSMIKTYLNKHLESFNKYIKEHYTSYDGFISSYSNSVNEWMTEIDQLLEHQHKLGAVLNFILLNEDKELEMVIYEKIKSNGGYLRANNYYELVKMVGNL